MTATNGKWCGVCCILKVVLCHETRWSLPNFKLQELDPFTADCLNSKRVVLCPFLEQFNVLLMSASKAVVSYHKNVVSVSPVHLDGVPAHCMSPQQSPFYQIVQG